MGHFVVPFSLVDVLAETSVEVALLLGAVSQIPSDDQVAQNAASPNVGAAVLEVGHGLSSEMVVVHGLSSEVVAGHGLSTVEVDHGLSSVMVVDHDLSSEMVVGHGLSSEMVVGHDLSSVEVDHGLSSEMVEALSVQPACPQLMVLVQTTSSVLNAETHVVVLAVVAGFHGLNLVRVDDGEDPAVLLDHV